MEILRWVKRYAMRVVAALLVLSVLSSIFESTAADSGADGSLSTTEVANHFLDAIGQYLGVSNDDLVVTRADSEKAKIGTGIMYDFGVETSDRTVEFSLVTDTSWQSYEQGMLGPDKHGGVGGEEDSEEVDEGAGDREDGGAGTVGVWQDDNPKPFPHRTEAASIPTFQMAGPVELWLQDAENVRLAMPHDVDAGRLKRVVVADGAVVKIQGPREVSLIGTLQLPLPLGSSSAPNPGGLLGLATRLRAAARSQDRPVVSLRVVGPTSLVAVPPQGIQDEAAGRLKVRRLAPGAVELVSREEVVHGDVEDEEEEWGTELSEVWVWPLPQLRGSDLRLAGVERAFHDVLGSEAYKKGYFRLTKAKASVVTLMQVRFEVGKQNTSDTATTGIADGEIVGESDMGTRTVWEATVKIDGQRVQPLNARPIESHVTGYSMQPLHSNRTLLGSGNLGLLGPMALDVNWGYYGV